MQGHTGLFGPITRPKYQDKLLISYEGSDQGPIFVSDTHDGSIGNTHMDKFEAGGVYIVDRTDQLIQSIQGGEFKRLMDPAQFGGNPPLKVYRMMHIV